MPRADSCACKLAAKLYKSVTNKVIQSKRLNITIMLSVFIISVSLFTYQIILTRLYSAILFHHYVFLTTSFAVLGVGVGSIFAYMDRVRLKKIAAAGPE